MNPEAKALWVAALRSGEYKQGRLALKSLGMPEPMYCCLGVLCEVALKSGLNITYSENEKKYGGYDGAFSSLPESVAKWAGLEGSNPVLGPDEAHSAIKLNDRDRESFDFIADLIEKHL